MITKTAYEALEEIANIVDPVERKRVLRATFIKNRGLATIVQRCYHPDYNWDLFPGGLPETIAKKSGHREPGPLYHSMRRWGLFQHPSEVPTNGTIKKSIREAQFISLYESVSSSDADILIAVKDKKLPWETLSVEFVVDAVPELFPSSFRADSANAPSEKPAHARQFQYIEGETKVDMCKRLMQENPGLIRKNYLELFEEHGISKVTGAQYYQRLKDVV